MQTTENKTQNINPEDLRSLGQWPISLDQAGKRLDCYLAKEFPFFTRSSWQRRIQDAQVFVNDTPPGKASYRIALGDRITMFYPRQAEPKVSTDLRVLFQNHGVMAIAKPSGLPMHENGPYLKNTFAHILVEKFGPEWAAVHRLDRETSGIVICANSQKYRAAIAQDLAKRQIEKSYLAIVEGEIASDYFSERAPLGPPPEPSAIRIKRWVNFSEGLPSHTDFEVVERANGHTLVRAFPRTGRTNQIRIHLAYNGHRILGDKLYHPNEEVFLSYYEKNSKAWVDAESGFHRLCLHAEKLVFFHPGLQSTCVAECPMDEELEQLWGSIVAGDYTAPSIQD